MQRQAAATAYLKSKQLLLFVFAQRYDATMGLTSWSAPLRRGGDVSRDWFNV